MLNKVCCLLHSKAIVPQVHGHFNVCLIIILVIQSVSGTLRFLMLNCLQAQPIAQLSDIVLLHTTPIISKNKDLDVAIGVGNTIYFVNNGTQVARVEGRTKVIGWFKGRWWQQKDQVPELLQPQDICNNLKTLRFCIYN